MLRTRTARVCCVPRTVRTTIARANVVLRDAMLGQSHFKCFAHLSTTRLGSAAPLLAPPAVCMHATTTSSTGDCANACSIQTSTPTSSTGDCANACSIRTSTPLLASRGRTTARMVFARALVHTTARAFLCVLQNNVNISTIAWLYDGKNNARASTCPHNCMIVFCALQNDFNTSTLDG